MGRCMLDIDFGAHISVSPEGWFDPIVVGKNSIELHDCVSCGDLARPPLLDDGEAVFCNLC
jgi:hypothetical protein